ncbi:MAG: hypothetical protein OEZ43_15860 [Gammaproteobacteria bacterium]|nr:hypothetical protein [Gammaproteobacteria bacterium]
MSYEQISKWKTEDWNQSVLKAANLNNNASGMGRSRTQVSAQDGVCFAAALIWGDLQYSESTQSWGSYSAVENLKYEDAMHLFQRIGQWEGRTFEEFRDWSYSSATPTPAPRNEHSRNSQIQTSINFLGGMREYMPHVGKIEMKIRKKTECSSDDLASVINLFYKNYGGVSQRPFVFAYQQGNARHAIGFAFDEDDMYFFEPNSGEYNVSASQIGEFITRWVQSSAKAFRQEDPGLKMYYILSLSK